MNEQLPNFFVIGVAKAGTSSLDEYLREHPDVFMFPKETRYFDLKDREDNTFPGPNGSTLHLNGVKSFEKYTSFSAAVENEHAIGDNSPDYIISDRAPKNIREAVPHARLIALLRDPVDRAYSHFKMGVRSTAQDGPSTITGNNIDAAQLEKRLSDPFYTKWGQYHKHLSRYLELFPREQLKIVFFEDLATSPRAFMQDLYSFLGVDDTFHPHVEKKYNVGGVPKSNALQTLIKGNFAIKTYAKKLIPSRLYEKVTQNIHAANQESAPDLPQDVRRALIPSYREDILRLQELVNRDLSGWLH